MMGGLGLKAVTSKPRLCGLRARETTGIEELVRIEGLHIEGRYTVRVPRSIRLPLPVRYLHKSAFESPVESRV